MPQLLQLPAVKVFPARELEMWVSRAADDLSPQPLSGCSYKRGPEWELSIWAQSTPRTVRESTFWCCLNIFFFLIPSLLSISNGSIIHPVLKTKVLFSLLPICSSFLHSVHFQPVLFPRNARFGCSAIQDSVHAFCSRLASMVLLQTSLFSF